MDKKSPLGCCWKNLREGPLLRPAIAGLLMGANPAKRGPRFGILDSDISTSFQKSQNMFRFVIFANGGFSFRKHRGTAAGSGMPIPIGTACRGEREARFPVGGNDAVFRNEKP